MAKHRPRPNGFGRQLLVRRALDEGRSAAQVTEELGVSRATAFKWLRRFRDEGEEGLLDRTSPPHRSPRRLAPELEAAVIAARVRRRYGPHRLAPLLGLPDPVAADLHALLGAAGIEPPYVLLPHSLGGWAARVFTAAYPDEVAGVVFIDSSHPDQIARHRAILPPVRSDEDPGIASARAGNEALVTTPPRRSAGSTLVTAADEL